MDRDARREDERFLSMHPFIQLYIFTKREKLSEFHIETGRYSEREKKSDIEKGHSSSKRATCDDDDNLNKKVKVHLAWLYKKRQIKTWFMFMVSSCSSDK